MFSRKEEPNIVAKYSDRLARISAWAHMMRFRATVCCPGAFEIEEAKLDGVGGSSDERACSSRRSRQTNWTSPVSWFGRDVNILYGSLIIEPRLTRIVQRGFEPFQKIARHIIRGWLLREEGAYG